MVEKLDFPRVFRARIFLPKTFSIYGNSSKYFMYQPCITCATGEIYFLPLHLHNTRFNDRIFFFFFQMC